MYDTIQFFLELFLLSAVVPLMIIFGKTIEFDTSGSCRCNQG